MKKILLFSVFAIGFVSNAKAVSKFDFVESNIIQEKQFVSIEISSIPADVLKNISSRYGGFTIKEAHVAKYGEYKSVLVRDDKTSTAHFTSTGEFIKEA